MTSTLSSGRPAYATATMVQFAESDEALVCLVATSDARRIVVTAPPPSSATASRPAVGSSAEVSWTHGALRMVPVELAGIQPERVPLWHFRVVGPVQLVQRRFSVRTPLYLPVQLSHRGRLLAGVTSDLSEGGFRCVLMDAGDPPVAAGDAADVALFLDTADNPVRTRAVVVRAGLADTLEPSLVLEFRGLAEPDQDRIRSRVFQEMRGWRADL